MRKLSLLFFLFFTLLTVVGQSSGAWYNYALQVEEQLGLGRYVDNMYLFPDTNIHMMYDDGIAPPQFHAVTTVVDPTSAWFGSGKYSQFMPYSVDSIGFYFVYNRLLSTGVSDTLLIEVFTSNTPTNIPLVKQANAGVFGDMDTIIIPFVRNKPNGTIKADSSFIVKYVLTPQDTIPTIGAYRYIKIGLPTSVYAKPGSLVGASIRFKPGYLYTYADTLEKMNNLRFVSIEQNGNNSFPIYYEKDYNTSLIAYTYTLFGKPTSIWGLYKYQVGTFVNTNSDFSYENHLISFYLTPLQPIGIAEESLHLPQWLSVVSSNPTSHQCTFEMNLPSPVSVMIRVSSIAGKEVMNIPLGIVEKGVHRHEVNLSHLPKGVYGVKIVRSDGQQVSRFIVVQ